jgi:hypothetical protein
MPSADERYRLVYEEATGALAQQERTLEGLRSRAGTLISATAISTSFLGGLAVSEKGLGYGAWVALAAFAGIILLALASILPLWLWSFETSAANLVEMLEGTDPPSQEQLWRDLALYAEKSYDTKMKLDMLHIAFILAGILLVVELAAWLAVLGGRA